jgi:hypothetical protein
MGSDTCCWSPFFLMVYRVVMFPVMAMVRVRSCTYSRIVNTLKAFIKKEFVKFITQYYYTLVDKLNKSCNNFISIDVI